LFIQQARRLGSIARRLKILNLAFERPMDSEVHVLRYWEEPHFSRSREFLFLCFVLCMHLELSGWGWLDGGVYIFGKIENYYKY
jgi:hypothetical protein